MRSPASSGSARAHRPGCPPRRSSVPASMVLNYRRVEARHSPNDCRIPSSCGTLISPQRWGDLAQVPRIEVGALNIVAAPHPPAVYRQIFSAIADKEVHVWGSDMAKITELREFDDKPGQLYGRVLVWAEIDINGKWLNKAKNIEATPEEKKVIAEALPDDLEPNFHSFNCIFLEKRHLLIVEFRNELGQRFGPSRAEKMLKRLLDEHLPPDAPDVDVTVIPEDETLGPVRKQVSQ